MISFVVGLYFYFNKTDTIQNPSANSELTIKDNSNNTLNIDLVKQNQDSDSLKSSQNMEKIKDIDQISNKTSTDINMMWITTFSLLVAFLSTIVSLYLYYWRYKLIANKEFLIPEKVVSGLTSQANEFNQLSQFNIQVAKLVENHLKKSDTDTSELKDILIQFQKSLNEKDQIISRYQQGYDNKIFKDYIGRFYRIYKFLIDLEQKPNLQDSDFKKIKTLFDDAFDQSGVEIFYPSIGINYLDEGEIIDDNPIIKLTTNESEDNKVIEINNPGLRFVDKQINNRTIIKSKVTILQYKEQ
tara:strand:+ start:68 stop:964 length:897 start_codon:yes stop_codon:yes gene_type:complete